MEIKFVDNKFVLKFVFIIFVSLKVGYFLDITTLLIIVYFYGFIEKIVKRH